MDALRARVRIWKSDEGRSPMASMKLICAAALATLAVSAEAQEHRELDAHVHGVTTLNIAIEGDGIAMELEAPGADIVGFEHPATSDADRAAIAAAEEALAAPLGLFAFPEAAGCRVTAATVSLVTEEGHHDEDGHAEHGHDEAADGDDHHDEAAGSDHAHDHDEAAEAHHDDEADEDGHAHEGEGGHTEFRATYALVCENIEAVTGIEFPYFEAFPNAEEVELNVVDDHGAHAFEVERPSPSVDLSSAS